MAGVGDELLLCAEGAFESREHVVEGVCQLPELVTWSVECQPMGEVGLAGFARRSGQLLDRAQDTTSDEPPGPAGQHRDAGEGKDGVQQQLVQGGVALRRRARGDPLRVQGGTPGPGLVLPTLRGLLLDALIYLRV